MKKTILDLRKMKAENRKIVMVTAYDYTFARIIDRTDVDVVLVGDSLGMVIQGHRTTLPVTLEEMIYHSRCVRRGLTIPLLVVDMPFLSYQVSEEEAVRSGGRLLKEGGAEAVKLEGGEEVCSRVEKMVSWGIPVMGHIGLTPQSINAFGGYRIQGKKAESARRLMNGAKCLQEAGVFSIVLEGIPLEVSREITSSLQIPTIGIGAGPFCSGQVLVIYDLLGMDSAFSPRFLKKYAGLEGLITSAIKTFSLEVRREEFPDKEHSFSAPCKKEEPLRG